MTETDHAAMLDCSSFDAALLSMRTLLKCEATDVLNRLDEFRYDRGTFRPEEDELLAWVTSWRPASVPTAVRWFHTTRVASDTAFEDGLLPTLAALPKVWAFIERLASNWISASQWREYRRTFELGDRHFSSQFFRKQEGQGWQGPFGFLLRDAALHRHDCHRDFRASSESAADICADFEQVFCVPMLEALELATRPCVVRFRTQGDYYGAVRAALVYIHRSRLSQPCGHSCNAVFNGRGNLVPRSEIECIEWPGDVGRNAFGTAKNTP